MVYDALASAMDCLINGLGGLDRFRPVLVATFAGLAPILALGGIYGLLMYAVQQRAREIGIRIALGASQARIHRMVLGTGARLAAAGGTLGIAGAYGLSSVLKSLLFEVAPYDLITYMVAVLLVVLLGVAASLPPAIRATRVDVVDVLRS